MDPSSSSKGENDKSHGSTDDDPIKNPTGPCLRGWVQTHPTTVSRIPKHLKSITVKRHDQEESSTGHKTMAESLEIGIRRLHACLTHRQMRPIEYHHYPTSGPARFVRITNGAEQGEKIHRIENPAWWTNDFKWRLISYHMDAVRNPTAFVCIYLKDFPKQVQGGIPWADGDQRADYQRLERWETSYWKRTTFWYDREPSRMWHATLIVRHENADRLLAADCRKLIHPRNIYKFSLHQRIGSDTYKEVVRFDASNAYGNDLLGQKLTVWSPVKGVPEELKRFICSLYPS